MLVVLAPLSASIAFVHFASKLAPVPDGSLWLFLVWWALISAAATLVLVGIDRVTRRLLPLAALLKLSLVFPDEAPSRFKTALRSGTVKTLEERLEDARAGVAKETPVEAAQRLLELVAALDQHDKVTRGHSERVRAYSQMIAKELGLGKREVELLNWSALLHDVGKLEVPAEILNKQGKPTDEEWAVIRAHPSFGEELVVPLRSWLGEWSDAVGHHHERWDGKGYPRGRSADEIALAGRIVAVADVFDVITSARSYKVASGTVEGRNEIARCAGSQFDPRVVRAFLSVSLGRLRFAMGPLSWLAHAPILGRIPLTPAIGSIAGSVAVVSTSLTAGLVPPPKVDLANPFETPPAQAAAAPSVPHTATWTDEDHSVLVRIEGVTGSPRLASFRILAPPAAGRLASTSQGGIAYTPPSDYHGHVSIRYEACWHGGGCSTGAVDIGVRPVNDPPRAASDSVRAAKGRAVWVDVLANDRDVDGDRLTVAGLSRVSAGTASTDRRRVRVAPPEGFEGTITLTYTIEDGNGGSDRARVAVVVPDGPPPPAEANRPPVAVADTAATDENTPVAILVLANDSDPDGDPLELVSLGQPDVGSVRADGARVFFTPPRGFSGRARLTYTISDGRGGRSVGTIEVLVGDVNEAPVAVADSASVPQGRSIVVDVLANDSDPDGDVLGVRSLVRASAGSVALSGGRVRYTAPVGFEGVDSFRYAIADPAGLTAAATVEVEVIDVNAVPSFVAGPDQEVPENAWPKRVSSWATGISPGPPEESDQTVSFTMSSDNDALFGIAGRPLVSSDGTLTFAPAPFAVGTATVTVRAVDDGGTMYGGADTSAPQTFTITVVPVNDAPSFAAGADQTVLEDAGAQSVPGWATSISPGTGESGQAVSFTVSNDNAALFSDQPDVSSDGTLTYTPAPDANGSATVTVRAVDDGGTLYGGSDTSTAQTFTISVTAVNDAPSFAAGADQSVLEGAGAQSVSGWATSVSPGPGESGQAVSFSVSNDDTTLFTAGGQPLVSAAGTLTYAPAPFAVGSATVSVTAADDGGTANGGDDTSAAQTFTITVTAVNDAPSFAAGADETVLEDAGAQAVSGWATGISAGPADESGQSVSFTVTNDDMALFSAQPAVASDGTLTYTAAADANGSATVSVTAADDGGTANGGDDTSAAQTFTITVTAVNDPPVANDDSPGLDEDAAGVTFGVLANDTDPDTGDTISVSSSDAGGITSGTLTDNGGGSFTYVPAAGWNGSESFTYTVADGNGGSDSATVTITVAAVADDPDAADDAYTTPLLTDLVEAAPGVLANDADEDGDSLTVDTTPVSGPSDGTLALNADGSFTYSPDLLFTGTDSFTYRVQDGTGRSDTATVSITVDSALTSSTLYLGSSGSSSEVWDISALPPASSSPVPDYDGDGNPGLTIAKSDGKETNTNPDESQTWVFSAGAPLVLNGPVTLGLWSTVAGFLSDKDAHPHVYLYDCAAGGSGCVKLAENDVHVNPWNGGVADWTYKEITIGSVSTTIAAGRELRVKLYFAHENIWIAATAAYPSALELTLG